ncbi:hypothetical protein QA645_19400 [Bradyrhizobium sp. CIAT3101]|uniref:hypothetical protein n=1 Tax=Bradyrhizobium sp. CIAT3101 TaxID=439387 RepID=UPI0024B1235B|nr:hypothetical protein [Bradyrhizobium sp. CIAT3101]WFU84822.1 hypothetical protein QA645_19400 [Bradyrhizobium sp. CIAT3101]
MKSELKPALRREWRPLSKTEAAPSPEPRPDPMGRWVAWSTIANTVLTSLIGGAAAYVAYQAYLATQGQFAEARLANRPWITAEPSAKSFELSFGYDGNNTVLRVPLKLRNIGHSPAQFAWISKELYDTRQVSGGSRTAPMVAQQRSLCRDDPTSWTPYLSLFPDQETVQNSEFFVLNQYLDEHPRPGWKKTDDVVVTLIGCVRYLDSSGTAHHTYFAYDLLPANKDGSPVSFQGRGIDIFKTKLVTYTAAQEAGLFFAD